MIETVRLLQRADLGIGHGIQGGIAHERWAEKASRTSLVVVSFSFMGRLAQASLGIARCYGLSINDGFGGVYVAWHIHTMRRSGIWGVALDFNKEVFLYKLVFTIGCSSRYSLCLNGKPMKTSI